MILVRFDADRRADDVNRRQQIPAGLFILGAILVVLGLVAGFDGIGETVLYVVGGFLMLFGALMAWSLAKQ